MGPVWPMGCMVRPVVQRSEAVASQVGTGKGLQMHWDSPSLQLPRPNSYSHTCPARPIWAPQCAGAMWESLASKGSSYG